MLNFSQALSIPMLLAQQTTTTAYEQGKGLAGVIDVIAVVAIVGAVIVFGLRRVFGRKAKR
jgi:hypothetical protein